MINVDLSLRTCFDIVGNMLVCFPSNLNSHICQSNMKKEPNTFDSIPPPKSQIEPDTEVSAELQRACRDNHGFVLTARHTRARIKTAPSPSGDTDMFMHLFPMCRGCARLIKLRMFPITFWHFTDQINSKNRFIDREYLLIDVLY